MTGVVTSTSTTIRVWGGYQRRHQESRRVICNLTPLKEHQHPLRSMHISSWTPLSQLFSILGMRKSLWSLPMETQNTIQNRGQPHSHRLLLLCAAQIPQSPSRLRKHSFRREEVTVDFLLLPLQLTYVMATTQQVHRPRRRVTRNWLSWKLITPYIITQSPCYWRRRIHTVSMWIAIWLDLAVERDILHYCKTVVTALYNYQATSQCSDEDWLPLPSLKRILLLTWATKWFEWKWAEMEPGSPQAPTSSSWPSHSLEPQVMYCLLLVRLY